MFHNFLSLQSDMIVGILDAFSSILDAFFSKKSFPTSMFFLLTYIELRTVELFPTAES